MGGKRERCQQYLDYRGYRKILGFFLIFYKRGFQKFGSSSKSLYKDFVVVV